LPGSSRRLDAGDLDDRPSFLDFGFLEGVQRFRRSILFVPYGTSAPAPEDIIAGRVSMMFADFTSVMPDVTAGTVRALAISRIKRSSRSQASATTFPRRSRHCARPIKW